MYLSGHMDYNERIGRMTDDEVEALYKLLPEDWCAWAMFDEDPMLDRRYFVRIGCIRSPHFAEMVSSGKYREYLQRQQLAVDGTTWYDIEAAR